MRLERVMTFNDDLLGSGRQEVSNPAEDVPSYPIVLQLEK